MTPNDPRLQAALGVAIDQIRATLTEVAGRVSDGLGLMAQSSGRIAERDLLITTQFEMRRNLGALNRVFGQELTQRTQSTLTQSAEPKRKASALDWQSLSLVDDSEMEERMFSDRVSQQISHACEAELRDLATYMGSLLNLGHVDQERNPLRAEVIGASLYRAIETTNAQPDSRKLLTRELGAAMAKAMPACYAQIVRGLHERGVRPVVLTVRQVEGPGNQLPGVNSTYANASSTRSQFGEFDTSGFGDTGTGTGTGSGTGTGTGTTGGGAQRSTRSGSAHRTAREGGAAAAAQRSRPGSASTSGAGAGERSAGGSRGDRVGAGKSAVKSPADAQLMALLRHLTAAASQSGELDESPVEGPAESGPAPRRLIASGVGTGDTGSTLGSITRPSAAEGLTGLMAVNLIRAHREELKQASTGKLDHMVIDVVGSLFDQILSDTRVPPQMARQIARLQLPVLRVALSDSSFFSSRRHPVRRFVNRIGSLACAFDDFDAGPGKQFLKRVSELVQEIVEGDFDQIEIYAAKLAELETFIAEQTHDELQKVGVASTVGNKENELRLQQRYMLQLRSALAPISLPAYLREFLPQVWSQAIALAASRDGHNSDRIKRYRRVGGDLVMSVQPKGSPILRKKFLMQLPPLMKDLNEGLALIGWPDAAQRDFLAHLLPAHAESLKAQPQSELDYNLMAKQLEAIFNLPVPGAETLTPADAMPEVEPEVIARQFTPEEVKRVGLVSENAVDWSVKVDVDLDLDLEIDATGLATAPASALTVPGGMGAGADSAPASLSGIDIDLSLTHADPAEPMRGAQLIDHIKLGFAYQMQLKDEWQKVRLAHVSPGRTFFVFKTGNKHQETISMTSRMVARMCETGRMRAVESAYLMERATNRARKQLAALGGAAPR